MEVSAYDPFVREIPEYIQLVENREEIFRRCDYVSLHVPATEEAIDDFFSGRTPKFIVPELRGIL